MDLSGEEGGSRPLCLDIAQRGGLAVPADALPLVFPMTTQAELLARAWLHAATLTVEQGWPTGRTCCSG